MQFPKEKGHYTYPQNTENRWIFSIPLRSVSEAMIIVNRHPNILYDVSLYVRPSTIYTETVGYASHSLETIFTTTFKTTFHVQFMFGKPHY